MKVGLIVPANLKYSPYVKYYTDVLSREKVDYCIMSWDKAGIEEAADMAYSYKTSDFDRKRILLGHLKFAFKCRKYIRKEKIDHLIIFTIAPLYFLGYKYVKRFRGKLIIDIRDDSPFRRRFPRELQRFSRLAKLLVVSSTYYAEWFDRKSILCHNVDKTMMDQYSSPYGQTQFRQPVRIVFAGMMIEEVENIRVIKVLGNRVEFELVYVGRDNEGKNKVKQFVNDHSIRNVSFEGEYRKEDIVNIYRKEADLVNILREETLINRNALPNKFYDAVLSGIPIVVYGHNKAIADYVNQYKLGVVLHSNENIGEAILRYIQTFDSAEYTAGREEFLHLVKSDLRRFEKHLLRFCGE